MTSSAPDASRATVFVHDEGVVRTIAISNPAKKNALTRTLLDDLVRALPTAPAGPSQPVRVVVLTGDPAGGAFSSGYDIAAIDDAERARGLDPIDAPATALENCPVPVIAAINGHVFGGAFELAVACHLRVVSPTAKLGMPPAKLGLVYSPRGLQRFLRVTSASTCQRMFLVGAPLEAHDAHRLGLVDVVAEDCEGGALDSATELPKAIGNNAPLAVAGLLDAIRCLSRGSIDAEDLEAIERAREATVASSDLREVVLAFVERRAPQFRGE